MTRFGRITVISIALCATMPTLIFAGTLPGSAPDVPAIDTNSSEVQEQAHLLALKPAVPPLDGHKIVEDHSGRKQVGKASIYSNSFQGKTMANGKPFDHGGQAAASKTLPLGTAAKVTNLENGRTAEVTVEDHGPYANGRTIDLSKSTAKQLGLTEREGVAPVVVAPIAVPQPDGSLKPGAGALPGPATAQ